MEEQGNNFKTSSQIRIKVKAKDLNVCSICVFLVYFLFFFILFHSVMLVNAFIFIFYIMKRQRKNTIGLIQFTFCSKME